MHSHDSTGVPERVVRGCQGGALRGVSQLCDQERSGIRSEGETEPDEETLEGGSLFQPTEME